MSDVMNSPSSGLRGAIENSIEVTTSPKRSIDTFTYYIPGSNGDVGVEQLIGDQLRQLLPSLLLGKNRCFLREVAKAVVLKGRAICRSREVERDAGAGIAYTRQSQSRLVGSRCDQRLVRDLEALQASDRSFAAPAAAAGSMTLRM